MKGRNIAVLQMSNSILILIGNVNVIYCTVDPWTWLSSLQAHNSKQKEFRFQINWYGIRLHNQPNSMDHNS
jgi:hypothetical protein